MKQILSQVTTLTGSYPETYFAGANTNKGFRSTYPIHLPEEELSRLYILKGGSGTGKSTLMHKCAKKAASAGASVALLLCSSDPSSADAVILTGKNGKRIAIVDGTAPHTLDPAYPGVVGEIVNLGDCWHTHELSAHRQDVAMLILKKQKAYRLAYRYLAAYGETQEIIRDLLSSCMYREKLAAAVERILNSFSKKTPGKAEIRITAAVSMHGLYRLDTFPHLAKRTYAIEDVYGSAAYFFEALRQTAQKRGTSIITAPPPGLFDGVYEAYFPCDSTAFVTVATDTDIEKNSSRTPVNMRRFIDRSALANIRGKLRFADRCAAMTMEGALAALEEAKNHHFGLEGLYKSVMDFDAVSEISDMLASRILSDLM